MQIQFSQNRLNYSVPNLAKPVTFGQQQPMQQIPLQQPSYQQRRPNTQQTQIVNQSQQHNYNSAYQYNPYSTQNSRMTTSEQPRQQPKSTLISQMNDDLQKLKNQLKKIIEPNTQAKQSEIKNYSINNSVQFTSSPERATERSSFDFSRTENLKGIQKRQTEIQKKQQSSTPVLEITNLRLDNTRIRAELQAEKNAKSQLQYKISQMQRQMNSSMNSNQRSAQFQRIIRGLRDQLQKNKILNEEVKSEKDKLVQKVSFLSQTITKLENQNYQYRNKNLQSQSIQYSPTKQYQQDSKLMKEKIALQIQLQQQAEELKFYKNKVQNQSAQTKLDEKTAKSYEEIIQRLKKDIKSLQQNIKPVNITQKQSEFNELLKQQLVQVQKYKQSLKEKTDQILSLSDQLSLERSSLNNYKSELEIEKLKATNEKKALQLEIDAIKNNTQNQINTLKKIAHSLEEKLKMALTDTRKKDEFIKVNLIARAKYQEDKQAIKQFFKQYETQIPQGSLSEIIKKDQIQIMRLEKEIQIMKVKLEQEKKIKQRVIYRS